MDPWRYSSSRGQETCGPQRPEHILDEFKRVLTSGRFGLSLSLVEQMVDEILLFTCQVTPLAGATRWTSDVQDDPVVETAIAARAAFLVTGDRHLLEAQIREVEVVTVAEKCCGSLGVASRHSSKASDVK